LKFGDLTNEAKLVFIIGEPLRQDTVLSVNNWHRRVFIEFVEATGLDWDDYVVAFSEVSDWIRLTTGHVQNINRRKKLVKAGQLEMF
jgi:hypothetical protein